MCKCPSLQLVTNSKDRINYLTPTGLSNTNSFTVRLIKPTNVSKIKLEYVQLPNTIYNVTVANNIIPFNEGGSDKFASIQPGAYSLTSLMTAIGDTMTTSSGINTY